jgi:Domain of unknown function (DUF4190)
MKQCSRCNRTYSDDGLNFCLDDGELLTTYFQESQPQRFADDPPPTVLLNEARATNPTNWPSQSVSAPPAPWQGQQIVGQQGLYGPTGMASPDQTLAVTSLCLGIASVTVGWCCSTGLLLAPAALITGFIALSQIKKDPEASTGRGLAIGGIVTAVIYLSALLLFLVIYGIAIIGGGLSSIN